MLQMLHNLLTFLLIQISRSASHRNHETSRRIERDDRVRQNTVTQREEVATDMDAQQETDTDQDTARHHRETIIEIATMIATEGHPVRRMAGIETAMVVRPVHVVTQTTTYHCRREHLKMCLMSRYWSWTISIRTLCHGLRRRSKGTDFVQLSYS